MRTSRLVVMLVTILALSALGASSPTSCAQAPAREFWAFTGPWDARSDSSARAHARALDVVVTGWIALDSATSRPIIPPLFPDTMSLGGAPLRRMALVTSWHGDRFHPGTIRRYARDPRLLGAAAGAVARHARAMDYAGLVLDFEALERADRSTLLATLRAFADSAHAAGIPIAAAAIPATDTGAYPTRGVLDAVNYAIVMLYDEHWSTSEPGPIASPTWFRDALAARVAGVDANRMVAGLPTYGYWWKAKGPAANLSFGDARRIADSSGTPLERDRESQTMRARRSGEWDLWVTDASLVAQLVARASELGVHRFALWRLGQEDPAIWGRVVK
jgi:hypothetical protein